MRLDSDLNPTPNHGVTYRAMGFASLVRMYINHPYPGDLERIIHMLEGAAAYAGDTADRRYFQAIKELVSQRMKEAA